MSAAVPPGERYLLPYEVAALFRVDVRTVARWETAGRFRAAGVSILRSPSGQRRYNEFGVRKMLQERGFR